MIRMLLCLLWGFFIALAPGETLYYWAVGDVYAVQYTEQIDGNCHYRVWSLSGADGYEYEVTGAIPAGLYLQERARYPRLACDAATGMLNASSYIKYAVTLTALPWVVR